LAIFILSKRPRILMQNNKWESLWSLMPNVSPEVIPIERTVPIRIMIQNEQERLMALMPFVFPKLSQREVNFRGPSGFPGVGDLTSVFPSESDLIRN
jgi:hypothetical protein